MADQKGKYSLSDIQPATAPAASIKGQYSLLDINPYPNGEAKPATLPEVTNDDLKRWGKTALDYLPAAAATGAAIFAPEIAPALPSLLSGSLAAGVGGAAGEAVRQGTLATTGSEGAPSGVGDAALKTLKSGAEQGGVELGGRLLSAPFEWALGKIFNPERMYQSALKPSALKGPEEQATIVKAGLEGVPGPVPAGPLKVNEAAYHENTARISETNRRISDVIATRQPQAPGYIDPLDVAHRIGELEHGSFGNQALNADDLKTIRAAQREYLEKHGAQFDRNGNMITLPRKMKGAEAQAEKVATYAQNKGKYGETQRARDESEKAAASYLREGVAQLYPEVSDLNAQDSVMLKLDDALRSFVAREGNRNLLHLAKAGVVAVGSTAGALAGGAHGGVGAGMLAAAAMALDDPTVKSALAIALKTRYGRMALRGAKETVPVAGRGLLQIGSGDQR